MKPKSRTPIAKNQRTRRSSQNEKSNSRSITPKDKEPSQTKKCEKISSPTLGKKLSLRKSNNKEEILGTTETNTLKLEQIQKSSPFVEESKVVPPTTLRKPRGRPRKLQRKSGNDMLDENINEGITKDVLVDEVNLIERRKSGKYTDKEKVGNAFNNRNASTRELRVSLRKGRSLKRKVVSESSYDSDDGSEYSNDSDEIDFNPKEIKVQHKRTLKRILISDEESDHENVSTEKRSKRLSKSKLNIDFESDGFDKVQKPENVFKENVDDPPKRKRGRPKTNKECNKDLSESIDEDISSGSNELVTCQVCKTEMKANIFVKKHKQIHHGLCWTQNEEPIDYFDPVLVLEILGAKRKNLQVVTGRKHQIALSFACFFCPKVTKSELGYYSHLLVCNRTEDEIEKANKKCDKCEKVIFLPHYHAHELKHMKEEQVANEIEPEDIVSVSSPGTSSDGKRCAARRARSRISNITKNLIDGGDVESCKQTEDTEFKVMENDEAQEEDTDEDEGEKEEEESDVAENSRGTEEENDSVDEYGDSLMCGTETVVRRPLHTTFRNIQDLKFCYDTLKSFHSPQPLYEEFKVLPFEILNENSAQDYLPRTKTSIRLHCSDKASTHIDLFSAHVRGDRCILFCGGPVWAMAWCPRVFSQMRSDEYLAVAAQPDMNLIHEKNISQTYKSVIQIWKLPQISSLESKEFLEEPRMTFGIAHEEGAVWDLQWCPSGGFIPNERLGLLLAACSSGRILLYAIPMLSDVNGAPRIVSLEPEIILQIDETNSSPCYNIAWSHYSPHHVIYASYGDGFVAVFNIQSHLDPMVKLDQKTMLPVHMFQAHLTEILVLSLSSSKGTSFLLTSGNDRVTKMWDLTDLTSPVQVNCPTLQRKSTSGGFLPYLPLFVTSSDCTHYNDQAGMSQLAVRDFVPFRDTHMISRFIFQNCTHFTTSFSNYCSSLVSGSEDGHAYLFNYGSGLFIRGKQTILTVLQSNLINMSSKKDDDDDVTMTTHVKEKPVISSYEHACEKYKIDFFSKPRYKDKKPLAEESDIVNVTSSCWNNNVNNFRLIALGQKCGFVHLTFSPSHSGKQLSKLISLLKSEN